MAARSALAAALAVTLLAAACGERRDEPQRDAAAPVANAPATAPSTAARGDEKRPGFVPAEVAPPRIQPGQPTGNDAFRRAVEDRKAARSTPPGS